MSGAAPTRQRLDKWLWFARVLKSRTLAARLVQEGHVRVNGIKADAAAKQVAPGDVLTIALDRNVRILRVLAPGERRGPFPEACLLFEDLTPAPLPREEVIAPPAARDLGAGRPTKRDRRVIGRWNAPDE